MDLCWFGEGEAAPATEQSSAQAPETTAGRAKNPLASVQYGKTEQEAPPVAEQAQAKSPQPEVAPPEVQDPQTKKAAFEQLIKGDYKDLYDERVKAQLDRRFKNTNALKERVEALEPVLQMLGEKYGVDPGDANAVAKALQNDASYYEDEALRQGLSVEQLKHIKQMERENAELLRRSQERERQEQQQRKHAAWYQAAQELAGTYPGFDLAQEFSDPGIGPRLYGLLDNGVDLRTAYEVIHKDELMGGYMQHTANVVREKTVNDIRARGMRPAENGTSGNAASKVVKKDPSQFSRADREEIARRVLRGERIQL